jgi:hypothetical protein
VRDLPWETFCAATAFDMGGGYDFYLFVVPGLVPVNKENPYELGI